VSVKRRRLLAAVRERMRHNATVRKAEDRAHAVRSEPPPIAARPRPVERDLELEQLVAEARYHRDRFDLYRARVISGSSAPTSSARLRDLERAATAAEERVAHARRKSRGR
jgi:hypothetical protein